MLDVHFSKPVTRRDAATSRRDTRRRGLTLLEMLLALSGMALIGSAIASMLLAVSYGTQSDKDLRSLVTRQMALNARLSAAVRESSMVLEQGDGYLFLWGADTDESGTPNLDEIVPIEVDTAAQTLTAYRAPATPSANPAYDLAASFTTQTAGVKGGADFPAVRWASDVADFELTLDHATTQEARLVSYRLTLQAGEQQDVAVGAAALRNGGEE